ncbi:hypothetical protein [Akkermansia sp.]|uniref:hypothetical protein n=1 Tax=Akkermansia sp. TaxID=1872421 RepID=UPI003AAB98F6
MGAFMAHSVARVRPYLPHQSPFVDQSSPRNTMLFPACASAPSFSSLLRTAAESSIRAGDGNTISSSCCFLSS